MGRELRMEPNSLSDSELVQLAKTGDGEAFDQLVLRHEQKIYRLLYRILGNEQDARDLTQDTFLKGYRAFGSFREESAFGTWLYRIAINLSTSRKRTLARQRPYRPLSLSIGHPGNETHVQIDPPDSGDRPSEVFEKREIGQIVRTTIDTLNEDYREVLILRDLEGLSYDQIAAIADIPIGTVRSRIHRARLELRDRLQPHISTKPS